MYDPQLHPYVLPIMQGFIQVSTFHIPREPVMHETGDAAAVQYILISRRSRDRAGLRYQRRGVDDDANVANFVETEAVVHVEVRMLSCDEVRVSSNLSCRERAYTMYSATYKSADPVSQRHHLHASVVSSSNSPSILDAIWLWTQTSPYTVD